MKDGGLDPNTWGRIFDLPGSPETSKTEAPETIVGFRYCRLGITDVDLSEESFIQGIGGQTIHLLGPTARVPVLQSYSARYIWRPGWNIARCTDMESHPPLTSTQSLLKNRVPHGPKMHCGGWCGLWACTDIEQLTQVVGRFGRDFVLCGVQAEGKVVIHEHGWRAERAKLVAICPKMPGLIIKDKHGKVIRVQSAHSDVDPEMIEAVASFYSLQVVPLRHIEAEMRRLTDR